MATQRILLLTVGGLLADAVWQEVCRLSDARQSEDDNEWSSDDWPVGTQRDIDAFTEKIAASCFTLPILYRSEHVDCWSMGDVYELALVKKHPDCTRRLFTANHQVIATWVHFSEGIIPDHDAPTETLWLYARINEAINAWGEFVENRLVILVRSPIGGLWTNDDVIDALRTIPLWWIAAEPSHAQKTLSRPDLKSS